VKAKQWTAFEEFVHVHGDALVRLSFALCGDRGRAEDAAQEILVIVLTHLGSFKGESAFTTWVWKIAARRLAEVKRGRREADSFEELEDRLQSLRQEPSSSGQVSEAEAAVFAHEVRLRCTQAMLLGLDRPSLIAYVLGDVFNLSGDEAAAVLEIDPATYRKRLVRARERLYDFMRRQCGVFDPANPCRCERVAAGAAARGLVRRDTLLFANHPTCAPSPLVDRAAREVKDLMRVAEVIREHADYAAPEALVAGLRELVVSERLELFRS